MRKEFKIYYVMLFCACFLIPSWSPAQRLEAISPETPDAEADAKVLALLEASFHEFMQIDTSLLAADEKVSAWKKFLTTDLAQQQYAFSQRDDEIREKARQRLQYWQTVSSSRKTKHAPQAAALKSEQSSLIAACQTFTASQRMTFEQLANVLELSHPPAGCPKIIETIYQVEVLDLSDSQVSDINMLQGLQQLQHLNLNNTVVRDIRALNNLKQLTYLNLDNTQVRDISALNNLKQLTYFNLNHTSVIDISVLKNFKQLTQLFLNGTPVRDLSALHDLKQLRWLFLNGTQVRDINALKGLRQLTWLFLNDTQVTDISVLKDLKQLSLLSLEGTSLRPCSPQNLEELQSGRRCE